MDELNLPQLDPEKQIKAKEYSRIKRRLWLFETIWSAIYAVLWLTLGWALGVRGWLEGFTTNPWLLLPLFGFFYALPDSIATIPLSYYSGFVLPHRYELSTQSLKGWIVDQFKGMAVGLPIGILLLEIVYWILRTYPDNWWLLAVGILLIFQVLLANLAPTLIMPLFNKYVPLDEEHADLAKRLVKLAERAGTKVKGVYKFDMSKRTKAANAALTGIGNSRRIILGDTLLEEFTSDEIETVLAHELGHHVNKDIPLLIGFSTLTTVGGFYLVSIVLNWGVDNFGFAAISDPAALPLFGLILSAYSFFTMPLGNTFSRWRERLADKYALQTTGKSEAFASAMTRLANQNLADVDPEPWIEFWLMSHPALSKRIEAAKNFQRK